MSLKRFLLLGLAVLVILPAAALAWLIAGFNPNAYAPQITAAVQKATGRTLNFGGPIKMALSLTPTIEADNLTLSNPPGFTAPNLLSLSHIEAKIGLLPLLTHKLDIIKLVLVSPAITLQTNAAGQSDWDFSTPGPDNTASASTTPPASTNPYKIILESVEIQNAAITVQNPAGKPTTNMALADFTAKAASAAAPLSITAQAAYNGLPLTLTGTLGPIERLSGIGTGPWPADLTLTAANATASIKGAIAHPRTAQGYKFAVAATIPALEALAPALPPGLALPPIHNLSLAANIHDQGSTMPFIGDLSLKSGASDLSSLRPGLALQNLEIEMASLNTAPSIIAAGSINNIPLSLTGSTGAIARLLPAAWLPATAQPSPGNFAVNLTASAGDAKFTASGGIATPANLAGVAINLTAAIPDLSTLSPLAATPLPAWKNIAAQGTIIDPGGLGLARAAGLDSLTLTMDNAALGGDASVNFGPGFGAHPNVQIALKAQQINLDALRAAWPSPAATPSAPTAQAAPATSLLPTTKLPLATLNAYDADIQLAADSLIINNATYTALQTHATLQNGLLTINPLTAILPGGDVTATATLDASKSPAAATITLNAPALALSPFLKSLNLPNTAQGTINLQLNANATGNSPHDLAASLNGQLGLAAVNGIIDGTVLDAVLGTALRKIGLPESTIGAQGPVPVRCFAVRLDAQNGMGTIRALTLDSSRLQLQGGGHVNFGAETLGVILRPQIALGGGNQIGVPVEIAGSFTHPNPEIAPVGALQDAAKSALGLPVNLAQQAVGGNKIFGAIANTLGLGQGDVCPAVLSLARLGQPGPAAAMPATAPPGGAAGKIISGPQNLLNSLFNK